MTEEEKHRLSCYIRTLVERTDSPDAKHALDAVLEFIQNDDEFSEPEGLDEAAAKWCKENGKGFVLRDKSAYYIGETLPAFKAGAEWAFGQGNIVRGWIARHKKGELCLFWNKPEYKINLGWVDEHQHWREIDPSLFPEIKMKDSPVEVIIQIRKP